MFYYLRGYGSHLIVQDIGKNVKIYVKIDYKNVVVNCSIQQNKRVCIHTNLGIVPKDF